MLALQGDGGYPYAVPVNYVYEDGKLWFHGAKSGHKSDAIRRDPKVSFFVAETDQLVPEALTTYFRSVIAFGKVRILEDPEEVFAAIRKLGLQLNPDEDAVEKEIRREWAGLCCVEIGDNTVIGAGSVVTRFIPGNMLAVGVPCRVLREITEADKIPGLPDGMTGGFPKSRSHLLKNGRSVLDKQKKNRYNETIRGRFPLVSCD